MSKNSFIELRDSPDDIVSSIKFSPIYNHLLSGSWDGVVALYDTNKDTVEESSGSLVKIHTRSAVTDIAWDAVTGKKAYLSNVEGNIREIDLENGNANAVLGEKHDLGIQVLKSMSGSSAGAAGLLVSGSWDKSVQYIDVRAGKSVHRATMPGKVFGLDATSNSSNSSNKIVVSMANRVVHIYDIRNLQVPTQIRESGLRYQTRYIKCMPNGEGYAQSSIEGRVAIEYFDPSSEAQSKKYAFKCHRLPLDDVDLVSPVNSLTFHKKYGTLFTGGSDFHVCLWDHVAKKRLRQYSKFDQSVVSMDFDLKGNESVLAVATSDDSFKTIPNCNVSPTKPLKSCIYLKYLSDSEGVPKSKKQELRV